VTYAERAEALNELVDYLEHMAKLFTDPRTNSAVLEEDLVFWARYTRWHKALHSLKHVWDVTDAIAGKQLMGVGNG